MLSHHLAKFGVHALCRVHRPCESGDITFLICHVATWLKCHVTLWWGTLIISYHPARSGVHRPCKNGNITFFVCHVTTKLKCHVTLWVESPQLKSPPCYVWRP